MCFAMPIIKAGGGLEFRTFTKRELLDCIANDFTITSKGVGSEAGEEIEYWLDLSRPFRLLHVCQKTDIIANCNTTKTCIRTVGKCKVKDVYTRHKNCGYKVLESLGFITDVPLNK